MNSELFFIFNLLVLSFSAALSLFIALRGKRNLLLIVMLPVIVICCINAYNSVYSLLGFSRPNYIPETEVLVLQVVIEKKEFIHIWYLDPEASQPRAIKIPYSEQNARIVTSISDRIKIGQSAFAGFSKDGNTTYGVTIKQYEFSSRFQNKKTH